MRLSKSRYCKGVQCPKQLWLDVNKPEVANEINNQKIFENGEKVGDLARGYFGEYELVEYQKDKSIMVNQTKELLDKGVENIAEASFIYNDGFCAVDVLHKNIDGTYDIVEVKSSTHLKDVYFDDMTYQYYILTSNGLDIRNIYLMNVNGSYIRGKELDIKGYFRLNDCTDEVHKRAKTVEQNINEILNEVNLDNEPVREMGVNCESPYECPYREYCMGRKIEKDSILALRDNGLSKKKKYELINSGIKSFEDLIKNNIKLNRIQKMQVETEYYDKDAIFDKKAINKFLDKVQYPLYNLDFETMQLAIPEYEGTSPFQQIPFQYSLHVVHEKDGDVDHKEFLAKEGSDPRRALAERLCEDIPMNVQSIAYHMAFEKGVIQKLADTFPDLSEHLMNIRDNMIDLEVLFRKKQCYIKEMEGSYSIKYVLPAMCPNEPELDYHSLDGVHNGSEAMEIYPKIQYMDKDEALQARKNLLAYCRLDTLAMVKILEQLYKVVE